MSTELRALARGDRVAEFDCGEPSLNDWLARHAWAAHAGRSARVFCAIADDNVIGYYALSAGSVPRATAAGRLAAGAPDPVPVVVLGRLAVDRRHQGQGLGADVLVDALRRVSQAVDIIGARAVVVHAIDASAAAFYPRYGFALLPGHEHHLYLLVKDFAAKFK